VSEKTGEALLVVIFENNFGDKAFTAANVDLAENPRKLRLHLGKKGAKLDGTIDEQVDFVSRLLDSLKPEPVIVTSKPGFKNDQTFVLGEKVIGPGQAHYIWDRELAHPINAGLGKSKGSRDGWSKSVGEVAKSSSFLIFCICAALAAPLQTYVRQKRKSASPLAETATFNLVGESGSGKSSALRVAAGIFGEPSLLASWQFTRRGLEEMCEARNDLSLLQDDSETQVADGMNFPIALRHMTQVIPFGASKSTSQTIAREKKLLQLNWSTLGLTGGPRPTDQMLKGRSNGEHVRFIDLMIPPLDEGGIFDRPDSSDPRAKALELIKQLEKEAVQNYGVIFEDWATKLLERDRSELIMKRLAWFCRKVVKNKSGYDERFAKKFGLVYAAGRLAIDLGVLPWSKKLVWRAIRECYRISRRTARNNKPRVTTMINKLCTMGADPIYFPPSSRRRSVILDDQMLGLATTYRGNNVLALREDRFSALCSDAQLCKKVLRALTKRKVLIGMHGGARALQLPAPIEINGRSISKPRFLILSKRMLRKDVQRRG
jgi:energy-coupling factor transporter ATP-binding protein EcfA2